MRLDGKVAIITGSTKGIGATMAKVFAQEGARVVVTGRSIPEGKQVVSEISDSGGEAIWVRADQSNESDVKELIVTTVERFGGLDVLVNNAAPVEFIGSGREGPLIGQDSEDFDYILKVALYGPWWSCKYAIPEMQRRGGGCVINISSNAAIQGVSKVPSYTCAKGALTALTRQIAVEHRTDRIRCNTLVLGFVMSGTFAGLIDAHPIIGKAFDDVTLTRRGRNEDVAYAAVFLASDESEFINAVTLPIDGGLSALSPIPDIGELLGQVSWSDEGQVGA